MSPAAAQPVQADFAERQPRVLLIGLFEGIGGLVASVTRLPVVVISFASAEIDREARRLLRKRWPGLIEMGSVTEIDEAAVRRLASIFAPLVDFVLIAGGSPCQDLSSLNAAGEGLQGSRSSLFFEIPRIFELFSRHFAAKIV